MNIRHLEEGEKIHSRFMTKEAPGILGKTQKLE